MECFQELDEGALAIHFCELMPAVEIYDLAQKGDLLGSLCNQGSGLPDDLLNRATPFGSPSRRHDAEGAVHVASLHDGDEGGGNLLFLRQMLADRVLGSFLGCNVYDRGDRINGLSQFLSVLF